MSNTFYSDVSVSASEQIRFQAPRNYILILKSHFMSSSITPRKACVYSGNYTEQVILCHLHVSKELPVQQIVIWIGGGGRGDFCGSSDCESYLCYIRAKKLLNQYLFMSC